MSRLIQRVIQYLHEQALITRLRIMLSQWVAAITLIAVSAVSLSSAAHADSASTVAADESAMKSGLVSMFDEIYASRKPVRFEQIDVSDVVARYFPLGTRKTTIVKAFKQSPTSMIVEDTSDKVVVRDQRGQAMLDADASSVVITFSLDAGGTLRHVHAVRFKSQ